MNMDTELHLQNKNSGDKVEFQEENFEKNNSHFENVDHTHSFTDSHTTMHVVIVDNEEHLGNVDSQKIDDLHQKIDKGLQNIKQQLTDQEKKFENDPSGFGNADYSSDFENSDFNSQKINNLHKNTDIQRDLNQEVGVSRDRLRNLHPSFEKTDNIYIFENTNSKCQGDVDYGNCVEIIKMKPESEIQQHQICAVKHKKPTKDLMYRCKSNLKDTDLKNETSDFISKTENIDLDAGSSNLENKNIVIERNQADVVARALKYGNKVTSNENIERTLTCPNSNTVSQPFVCSSSVERDDADIVVSGLNYAKKLTGNENSDRTVTHPNSNSVSRPFVCSSSIESDDADIVVSALNYENKLTGNENSDRTVTRPNSNSVSRPFVCSVCLKQFTRSAYLRVHKSIHTTDLLHQCDICKKGFKGRRNLKQHMIMHSTAPPQQCSVCDKTFKRLSDLRRHLTSIHNSDRPHQCNMCDKTFKRKGDVNRHMVKVHIKRMNVHISDRPHQCNLCDKKFKTTCYLKSHMETHSSGLPHLCNICGKGFKRRNAFREHMASHSTERPHQCNVCEKRFIRISALRSHMIIHSTERPHQCNMCDKKYKRVEDLRHHVTSHSIEGNS